MNANKIELNGEVLLDLTQDTATPETVAEGVTFHMADGTPSVGTATMGGGGALVEKDVNFYDYDGTLLYSYTVAEAQALTALPEAPTHEGLTLQEWNWTLDELKEQNDKVDVGATYITDDGKSRLYISILAEGRMDVPLFFTQTVSNGVTVDWGDGSAPQTVSGEGAVTIAHTYANIGDYVITMEASEGCTYGFGYDQPSSFSILGYAISGGLGQVYNNMLKKMEIGNNVPTIGMYAFMRCSSLSSVTIPRGVTSFNAGGNFGYCYSLKSIVIPKGVTSISSSALQYCYPLKCIAMPKSLTSIGSGALTYCSSLKSVTVPIGVTISSSAFNYCYSLKSVTIPKGVTSIKGSAFQYCESLESIVIPEGVKTIESNLFKNCIALASVVIPEGVTEIKSSAFADCVSLTSIVIPQTVTKIAGDAFARDPGLKICDFTSHTKVPTLSGTSLLVNNTDCEIRVPSALYDNWIAATNWSTYASRIVAV